MKTAKKIRAAKLLQKMGGEVPLSFYRGEDGKDYVLTDADKEEIAKRIAVPVVEKEVVTEVTKVIKEVDIEEVKDAILPEIYRRLSYGGGNANRNIQVDGDNVLTPYTDINLIAGSNTTISVSANHTTKYMDITIASRGGGGGFTELAATGTVNGVNLEFTFTEVPDYIVSDGVWFKPLDNNGGVQWTNVGTTITMVNPPALSIFGVT